MFSTAELHHQPPIASKNTVCICHFKLIKSKVIKSSYQLGKHFQLGLYFFSSFSSFPKRRKEKLIALYNAKAKLKKKKSFLSHSNKFF
jgi:hypothetical protein